MKKSCSSVWGYLQAADGTVSVPGSAHAETALAGRGDGLVILDVVVAEALVRELSDRDLHAARRHLRRSRHKPI